MPSLTDFSNNGNKLLIQNLFMNQAQKIVREL